MTITSVAETLPSHRSASGAAFVQDSRRNAFDSNSVIEFHSLIKPTTELSKRGMDRWIEKLHEKELGERDRQDGLVGLLAKPLAILSPFFVAIAGKLLSVVSPCECSVPPNLTHRMIAASVFTDILRQDKE